MQKLHFATGPMTFVCACALSTLAVSKNQREIICYASVEMKTAGNGGITHGDFRMGQFFLMKKRTQFSGTLYRDCLSRRLWPRLRFRFEYFETGPALGTRLWNGKRIHQASNTQYRGRESGLDRRVRQFLFSRERLDCSRASAQLRHA